MSIEAPLRRLTPPLSENGYESPRSPTEQVPVLPGDGRVQDDGRRRRVGYTEESDITCVEGADRMEETSPSSGDRADPEDAGKTGLRKVGLRDRIGCFTWTWFTMTMATGGIANVLHGIPYRSEWLRIIGVILFLFNLVLFGVNIFCITLRFVLKPGSFKGSFTSPSESLFIATAVIAFGTILINMCQYGIPQTGVWFNEVMQVLFWLYISLSFLTSSGLYLILWSTQSFPIHMMTPVWIFPAYPMLLSAPFAANIIDALPNSAAASRIHPIAIAFGGIVGQGTGFLVSLMIYSAFIYRLMTQKLPRETTRPGMFVSVGPSGFTTAGIVHLGNTAIAKIAPNQHFANDNAAFFCKMFTLLIGLWLYGLCIWFFLVSVGAHWQLMQPRHPEHRIQFDMTWFSFVFPNTALVTATFALAKSLDSKAMAIFGTVMAVLLVLVWMFVFGMMIRALWLKRILWPEEPDGAERIRKRWNRQGRLQGGDHGREGR